MERLPTARLYGLCSILTFCILLSGSYIGAESENKEGEDMIDIMEEFKAQVEPILYMSNPTQWRIITYKDSWLKGRPVFCCIDQCASSVVLAKDEKEGWLRLSGGGDFYGMNKVLKDYKITREELNNSKAVVNFLNIFHELYLHPRGEVLSKDFVTRYGDDFIGWLHLDRNVENLKALCRDPEVLIENDLLTIKFNVITLMGAVERWSLEGRHIDNHISVEILSISVLKPIGTYTYGIIG